MNRKPRFRPLTSDEKQVAARQSGDGLSTVADRINRTLVLEVNSLEFTRMDASSFADQLAESLSESVETNPPPGVVIDLKEALYADWMGFDRLLDFIRDFPGKTVLVGVSSGIKNLLVLENLDPFLTVREDVRSGVSELARIWAERIATSAAS